MQLNVRTSDHPMFRPADVTTMRLTFTFVLSSPTALPPSDSRQLLTATAHDVINPCRAPPSLRSSSKATAASGERIYQECR